MLAAYSLATGSLETITVSGSAPAAFHRSPTPTFPQRERRRSDRPSYPPTEIECSVVPSRIPARRSNSAAIHRPRISRDTQPDMHPLIPSPDPRRFRDRARTSERGSRHPHQLRLHQREIFPWSNRSRGAMRNGTPHETASTFNPPVATSETVNDRRAAILSTLGTSLRNSGACAAVS